MKWIQRIGHVMRLTAECIDVMLLAAKKWNEERLKKDKEEDDP